MKVLMAVGLIGDMGRELDKECTYEVGVDLSEKFAKSILARGACCVVEEESPDPPLEKKAKAK